MYQQYSILAIIPARGGSKGVPRKNLRTVAGKSLLAWTIEAAQQSAYLDRCILSSEDAEIIAEAKNCRCEVPFSRPAILAEDDTPGIAPILHALDSLAETYDYVMVLQPTSPLRTAEDIDAAIQLCLDKQANACVSVTQPKHHPFWSFRLETTQQLRPLFDELPVNRQALPHTVSLNGAIYLATPTFIRQQHGFISHETLAYQMPAARSLDVDTEVDLQLCECLLKHTNAL